MNVNKLILCTSGWKKCILSSERDGLVSISYLISLELCYLRYHYLLIISSTAVMLSNDDGTKKEEKIKMNEQVILESVGKANRGNLGLRGKVRTRTQEIEAKSMDCVISTGAMSRCDSPVEEVVNEAFRILRPGGLFVFIEPDDGSVIEKVTSIFPEKIVGSESAGKKAEKAQARKEKDKIKKKNKGRKQSITDEIEQILASKNDDMMQEYRKDESADVRADILPDSKAEMVDQFQLKERPGISFERVSNLFDPFVTGIAVRP